MQNDLTPEDTELKAPPPEDIVLDISVRRDPEPDWRTIYVAWWDGLNAVIPAALAETRVA